MKDRLSTTPVVAYPKFELLFILTTDTPKVSVPAILSQVQDGIERTIAYASRQMKRVEEAYSALEAEMLALVRVTNYFRLYLYGRRRCFKSTCLCYQERRTLFLCVCVCVCVCARVCMCYLCTSE